MRCNKMGVVNLTHGETEQTETLVYEAEKG